MDLHYSGGRSLYIEMVKFFLVQPYTLSLVFQVQGVTWLMLKNSFYTEHEGGFYNYIVHWWSILACSGQNELKKKITIEKTYCLVFRRTFVF